MMDSVTKIMRPLMEVVSQERMEDEIEGEGDDEGDVSSMDGGVGVILCLCVRLCGGVSVCDSLCSVTV